MYVNRRKIKKFDYSLSTSTSIFWVANTNAPLVSTRQMESMFEKTIADKVAKE